MESLYALIALTSGLALGHFLTNRSKKARPGDPKKERSYGPEVLLPSGRRIRDYLISSDFPRFASEFHLNAAELANLLRLDSAIDLFETELGVRFVYNSGGRPQRYADFVSALRKRGFKAVTTSKHSDFRAVDVDDIPELSLTAPGYLDSFVSTAKAHGLHAIPEYNKDGKLTHVHLQLAA